MEWQNVKKANSAFWLNMRKLALVLILCIVCNWICGSANQPVPVGFAPLQVSGGLDALVKYIVYFRIWFVVFLLLMLLRAAFEGLKTA